MVMAPRTLAKQSSTLVSWETAVAAAVSGR